MTKQTVTNRSSSDRWFEYLLAAIWTFVCGVFLWAVAREGTVELSLALATLVLSGAWAMLLDKHFKISLVFAALSIVPVAMQFYLSLQTSGASFFFWIYGLLLGLTVTERRWRMLIVEIVVTAVGILSAFVYLTK